jgi:hypothetical protein
LKGAFLIGANLRELSLEGSDLSGADLRHAILREANLSNTILNWTDLTGADVVKVNLRGATLENARLGWTVFADIDFRGTVQLENVRHAGPSTIGLDTIHNSGGQVPGAFLRGCGVPETFISYARSLAGRAIEFYSCFISYSTKDQEFTDQLHADLQNKGVRCWFAPHDVRAGQKLHLQIEEAVRVYDRLLLILSEHSMSSEWVQNRNRPRPPEGAERRAAGAVPYQPRPVREDPRVEELRCGRRQGFSPRDS